MAVKTLPFGATPAELDKFRAEVSLLRKAASGCRGVCRLVEEPIEQDGQIYLVIIFVSAGVGARHPFFLVFEIENRSIAVLAW